MILSRNEKIVFISLILTVFLLGLLLIGLVGTESIRNQQILKTIGKIRGLTSKILLVKNFDFGDEQSNSRKLNLNKADIGSLSKIPGIKRFLAKKILKYAKTHNGIKSLRELLEIKGISAKKLRRLCNYITVIGGHSGNNAWGDKLNINFVSYDDLVRIPGISSRLAKKIIDFRDSNGGFFSIEDLKEIPGITESRFNKISSKLEVR